MEIYIKFLLSHIHQLGVSNIYKKFMHKFLFGRQLTKNDINAYNTIQQDIL